MSKTFFAYQTWFSAISITADKSYFTYPYLTHGLDKKQIATRVSIHGLYRRSRNSVIKTFGVDVIATLHATSIFNMADDNVWEHDLLMATPTLNETLEIKRYARKIIYHGCLVR